MDQAVEADRVLLVKSRFTSDGADLHWSLLFVPSGETLRALAAALAFPEAR
jgi:chemotaxis protein CheC